MQFNLWRSKEMPITISLPDDIALDILKQISEGLSKRHAAPVEPQTAMAIFARGIDETNRYVAAMAPGDTIHVQRFAHSLGIPTGAVSDTLQRLKRSGDVEMVRKGTWKKIVSSVALAA